MSYNFHAALKYIKDHGGFNNYPTALGFNKFAGDTAYYGFSSKQSSSVQEIHDDQTSLAAAFNIYLHPKTISSWSAEYLGERLSNRVATFSGYGKTATTVCCPNCKLEHHLSTALVLPAKHNTGVLRLRLVKAAFRDMYIDYLHGMSDAVKSSPDLTDNDKTRAKEVLGTLLATFHYNSGAELEIGSEADKHLAEKVGISKLGAKLFEGLIPPPSEFVGNRTITLHGGLMADMQQRCPAHNAIRVGADIEPNNPKRGKSGCMFSSINTRLMELEAQGHPILKDLLSKAKDARTTQRD
jgi:hypothetical protein